MIKNNYQHYTGYIDKPISRRKTFTINLDLNNRLNLKSSILALKIVNPHLGNIDVRLKFDDDDDLSNRFLNL